MATTQSHSVGPASVIPDGLLGEALSWLADQLGIGWGLLWGLIVPLCGVLLVALAGTVWLWRRYARSPSDSTGTDVFPGQVIDVRSAEGTRGQVFVEGSWWSVRSDTPLTVGQDVRITAVDRLELVVEPVTSHESQESQPSEGEEKP